MVRQLLDDPSCSEVVTLGRRGSGRAHEKLREEVIDFECPHAWADLVRGDVLFSALGTTIKKAGNEAAQYRVDHTYQLRVAATAAENGVPSYVLVSALGADPNSRFFYPRMKGELERDVSALTFRRTCILRPGFLAGARAEERPGERLMLSILRFTPAWRALASVRPLPAEVVARAALALGRETAPGRHVFGPAELFDAGATKADG
jgi:uncharacterized protein YbjT (DUF2867 family)